MKNDAENSYWLNGSFLVNLLEILPLHVFWKNKKGVYLGCNSTFARSLGLKKPEDVVGKSDYDLPVAKENSDSYLNDDYEVVVSGQPKLNIEEKQIFHDGREVFLLTSKVPLWNDNNEVMGILGIYTDITELKNTQKQLIEAKQKAELASRAKSEFIANMSHDIRTPITGMLGMIQALQNTAKRVRSTVMQKRVLSDADWRKLVEDLATHVEGDSSILMDATGQLLQLCNEILEVTRLEHGIQEKAPESFHIHEVLQHNIALLTPVARDKKLELVAEIGENLPRYITGIKDYTSRSLLNLLSNSLKFTEKGHVKVKVIALAASRREYKAGDEIKLQFIIEDTGIGIPEDKFGVIFEHFSRLTPSYKGIYTGSGLGLYTVKRYVESMKGRIELESKVGHGTCFKVTLPFLVADHASEPDPFTQHSTLTPQTLSGVSRKRLSDTFNVEESNVHDPITAHVLVVEDNMIAAMAVTLALKSLHCTVDAAESGEEAFRKAEENSYDLILMDEGLPDMSGVDVARKIRALANPKKSNVPIVALTGHANTPEMLLECLQAGMQDVLVKPASEDSLRSLFRKYVSPVKK